MADKKDTAQNTRAQELSAGQCIESHSKVSFEQALSKWESELEEDFQADRAAEQLGADDFAIRINAKA